MYMYISFTMLIFQLMGNYLLVNTFYIVRIPHKFLHFMQFTGTSIPAGYILSELCYSLN